MSGVYVCMWVIGLFVVWMSGSVGSSLGPGWITSVIIMSTLY